MEIIALLTAAKEAGFEAGTYSTKPRCWGSWQWSVNSVCAIGTTSSTTGFINCNNSSTLSPTDEVVEIFCIGPL